MNIRYYFRKIIIGRKEEDTTLPQRLRSAWRYLAKQGELTRRERKYYGKIKKIIPALDDYKKETVFHVIKRAETVGCPDLRSYYAYLLSNEEEQSFMKTSITCKGSHFFRGNDWELFIRECLSSYQGRDEVEVWCAGCSSGEEVYSIILALMDYVPLEGIHVLATDYNDELLERCRRCDYPVCHYDEIPDRYRNQIVLTKNGRRFTFRPEILARVQTRNLNLLEDDFPADFDVILCRNVLKFFSDNKIAAVQKKLTASLKPGGCIFFSADDSYPSREEIMHPEEMGVQPVSDHRCIYRKKA